MGKTRKRGKERTREKETKAKKTRENEERNKKEILKWRIFLEKNDLNDKEMYYVSCPRKDCSHALHFNGALIKLFLDKKSGTIDCDCRWDLK